MNVNDAGKPYCSQPERDCRPPDATKTHSLTSLFFSIILFYQVSLHLEFLPQGDQQYLYFVFLHLGLVHQGDQPYLHFVFFIFAPWVCPSGWSAVFLFAFCILYFCTLGLSIRVMSCICICICIFAPWACPSGWSATHLQWLLHLQAWAQTYLEFAFSPKKIVFVFSIL